MYSEYSVLMSVYIKENPQYLKQSIDSIISQTLPTNDFVIVEDGPLTDELNEILDTYEKQYTCIKLIKREKNWGLGASLNVGIQHCKNELIARMDSDDIAFPERCQKEVEQFNLDDELGIVGTGIVRFLDSINHVVGIKKMPTTYEDIYKYAKRRNPFNHPTVMYKKNAVINAGGYQETIRGEDFALFTKMIFEGVKGKNLEKNYLYYRADKEQFKRRTSWQDTKSVIKVVRKNYMKGYVSFWDLINVIIVQSLAFLIPKKWGGVLYKYIYLYR